MSNVYDIGDCVKLTATFTNSSGTAIDPTAVTLKIQDPSGNETTYTYALAEITKDSVGVYHKTFTVDEAGEWFYRFEGTGAAIAAEEKLIYVRESEFD